MATLTTRIGNLSGYSFAKDGTVTFVSDGYQSGTDVYWHDQKSEWVFVSHDLKQVKTVERIAAVRIVDGQDADEGLNQAALACDLDGSGTWIVDADWLEGIEDGYVETLFAE